ncbi:hypothetical protein AMELA_G00227270, partial [Ameiurus melas]
MNTMTNPTTRKRSVYFANGLLPADWTTHLSIKISRNSSITTSDFEYAGDNKSNCTLLIHNVQFSYSGEYKFRFITNVDKWTGDPGAI